MSEIKFDFDDILITPSVISTISSRKEVNPYYNGMLPIFTAPMDTVINLDTVDVFKQNKIFPIIPRTEILHEQNSQYYAEYFVAIGLDEAKVLIDMDEDGFNSFNLNHILIDVANGHMKIISKLVNKLKEKKPDMEVMIGNIANPKTYTWYAKNTNVDYIRVGVGMGSGCWVDSTDVLTNNGYKKIEDIEINDLVLTHTGEFKEVTNKLSYITEDSMLININGQLCTEDHEIFVIDSINRAVINESNYLEYGYWIEAKNVDEKKHLVVEIER